MDASSTLSAERQEILTIAAHLGQRLPKEYNPVLKAIRTIRERLSEKGGSKNARIAAAESLRKVQSRVQQVIAQYGQQLKSLQSLSGGGQQDKAINSLTRALVLEVDMPKSGSWESYNKLDEPTAIALNGIYKVINKKDDSLVVLTPPSYVSRRGTALSAALINGTQKKPHPSRLLESTSGPIRRHFEDTMMIQRDMIQFLDSCGLHNEARTAAVGYGFSLDILALPALRYPIEGVIPVHAARPLSILAALVGATGKSLRQMLHLPLKASVDDAATAAECYVSLIHDSCIAALQVQYHVLPPAEGAELLSFVLSETQQNKNKEAPTFLLAISSLNQTLVKAKEQIQHSLSLARNGNRRKAIKRFISNVLSVYSAPFNEVLRRLLLRRTFSQTEKSRLEGICLSSVPFSHRPLASEPPRLALRAALAALNLLDTLEPYLSAAPIKPSASKPTAPPRIDRSEFRQPSIKRAPRRPNFISDLATDDLEKTGLRVLFGKLALSVAASGLQHRSTKLPSVIDWRQSSGTLLVPSDISEIISEFETHVLSLRHPSDVFCQFTGICLTGSGKSTDEKKALCSGVLFKKPSDGGSFSGVNDAFKGVSPRELDPWISSSYFTQSSELSTWQSDIDGDYRPGLEDVIVHSEDSDEGGAFALHNGTVISAKLLPWLLTSNGDMQEIKKLYDKQAKVKGDKRISFNWLDEPTNCRNPDMRTDHLLFITCPRTGETMNVESIRKVYFM